MAASGEAFGFTGKVAVITGSTQGLGEGVARLMAARGAEGLVLCGRNAERGEALAKELSDMGSRTIFIQADLQKVADGKTSSIRPKKTSDVWTVWSTARPRPTAARSKTPPRKSGTSCFDMNVKSQFFMAQRAIEVMRRRKIAGTIVNIGTIVAHGGPPFLIPYSSSKGAL